MSAPLCFNLQLGARVCVLKDDVFRSDEAGSPARTIPISAAISWQTRHWRSARYLPERINGRPCRHRSRN